MKSEQIVRDQQSKPIKKNKSGGSLNTSGPNPVNKVKKKETQIIAIYGKGGIGKSFTLANLSYMMAQQGRKFC
jgi:Mrp family chromosome partitioning ATPase